MMSDFHYMIMMDRGISDTFIVTMAEYFKSNNAVGRFVYCVLFFILGKYECGEVKRACKQNSTISPDEKSKEKWSIICAGLSKIMCSKITKWCFF